jgi:hypothetical protein
MAQVKIYGIDSHLIPIREKLSAVIHECVVEALAYPRDKRAHRFFPMSKENLLYPEGRSSAYTLIEFHMIEGRTVATRKKLVRLLFERVERELGIAPVDLEVSILESPACNWGFRGFHGDEVQLNYRIDV